MKRLLSFVRQSARPESRPVMQDRGEAVLHELTKKFRVYDIADQDEIAEWMQLKDMEMYIARMYSYGHDSDCVGLDGIETCIGVFLAQKNEPRLFAIHVPDTGDGMGQGTRARALKAGKDAFVAHVRGTLPNYDPSKASLYGVANGTVRSTLREELVEYSCDLQIPRVTLIRFGKNWTLEVVLPNGQRKRDGVAVLCHKDGSGDVVFKYQKASQVAWGNAGKDRAGYYHNAAYEGRLSCNASLAAGWTNASENNATTTIEEFWRWK